MPSSPWARSQFVLLAWQNPNRGPIHSPSYPASASMWQKDRAAQKQLCWPDSFPFRTTYLQWALNFLAIILHVSSPLTLLLAYLIILHLSLPLHTGFIPNSLLMALLLVSVVEASRGASAAPAFQRPPFGHLSAGALPPPLSCLCPRSAPALSLTR